MFNQVIVRLWINFRAVRGRHRTPRIIFMHLEQPPPASPSRSRQGPRCRGGQRRAEGTCRRETRPRFLRHAVTERLVYLSHGAGAGDRALGAVDAEPMAQWDRQTVSRPRGGALEAEVLVRWEQPRADPELAGKAEKEVALAAPRTLRPRAGTAGDLGRDQTQLTGHVEEQEQTQARPSCLRFLIWKIK